MGGGTPGELNKQELRALQSAMQTQAHKGYRVAAGLMLGVIALTGIGASISRRGAGARSEGSAAEMPDAGVAAPITAPPEKAFRVCGQYCGDNWCSGQKIKESDCALLPELAEPEHCYMTDAAKITTFAAPPATSSGIATTAWLTASRRAPPPTLETPRWPTGCSAALRSKPPCRLSRDASVGYARRRSPRGTK